ncbi:hypothetical protein K474DRAFT_1689233 [Panus rudis PR-1116 ss-1]|nr:hypothetical protein K474DRAFT_1689233 [Panus rudis PR-1116 ss-1]
MSKVVFVGNVPYNMGEEQLIEAFKSVGQVIGFRLVYDRDTGKPKGYGFCEFADHDTALSAVRNLNGQDVGGRPLRIDLADSDPFLEGKTTVRGELIDAHEARGTWREHKDEYRGGRPSNKNDPNAFLANLPPGIPVPPGASVLDAITTMLGTTNPSQILEVLAQMKAFVITHPEQAHALLRAHPQLGYALFQALLVNKIVDPAILTRMLNASQQQGPPPNAPVAAPAPVPAAHVPPPMPAPYPQHSQPVYNAPPPSVPMAAPVAPTPPIPTHTPVYAPPPPPGMVPGQIPPPGMNPYYRAPPPPVPAPPSAGPSAPPQLPPQPTQPQSQQAPAPPAPAQGSAAPPSAAAFDPASRRKQFGVSS